MSNLKHIGFSVEEEFLDKFDLAIAKLYLRTKIKKSRTTIFCELMQQFIDEENSLEEDSEDSLVSQEAEDEHEEIIEDVSRPE